MTPDSDLKLRYRDNKISSTDFGQPWEIAWNEEISQGVAVDMNHIYHKKMTTVCDTINFIYIRWEGSKE